MEAEVAIVGAGPAGLAAALELAAYGVDVAVVDEQSRPGGQIFRQPPASFRMRSEPAGATYVKGKELLRAAATAKLRWVLDTTTWGVFPVGVEVAERRRGGPLSKAPATAVAPAEGVGLALFRRGEIDVLRARKLLLAPGAYDMPVAFPGWTLPGVMAAGGIQNFVKSQGLVPGERFCLVGAHPLQWIVADQLVAAGAEVAAVCFAQPPPSIGTALPALASLSPGSWGKLFELGAVRRRLAKARVRILFRRIVVAASGDGEVERVTVASIDDAWRPIPGTEEVIPCDTLGINYGFVPSTELARQAGCAHVWNAGAGGWIVEHDAWMRSSHPAIAVAGEITGIEGAESALAEGRIAALGILLDLGRLSRDQAERRARPVRAELRRAQRFARLVQRLFAPRLGALARLMDDDTVLCRCEEVTAGQVRKALRDNPHLGSANAVKLLTRTGMGPCQGRYCALGVASLVAAHSGKDIGEVGGFTARPPVKPIPLAALAAYWERLEDSTS